MNSTNPLLPPTSITPKPEQTGNLGHRKISLLSSFSNSLLRGLEIIKSLFSRCWKSEEIESTFSPTKVTLALEISPSIEQKVAHFEKALQSIEEKYQNEEKEVLQNKDEFKAKAVLHIRAHDDEGIEGLEPQGERINEMGCEKKFLEDVIAEWKKLIGQPDNSTPETQEDDLDRLVNQAKKQARKQAPKIFQKRASYFKQALTFVLKSQMKTEQDLAALEKEAMKLLREDKGLKSLTPIFSSIHPKGDSDEEKFLQALRDKFDELEKSNAPAIQETAAKASTKKPKFFATVLKIPVSIG